MQPVATTPQGDVDAPKSQCSEQVLKAIYGDVGDKKADYEKSLKRWWSEYASRKNHEEDEHEHVANSLLYDRNHLPRTAPAPDCVNEPPPAPLPQQ
ncbi:hypothetical protein Ndes2526A_g01889 [Nannochloris sp. 'desiccata']